MSERESVSGQPAWYEDQPYSIGDRVAVVGAHEPLARVGEHGRVVGYDASGPRRGEVSVRVLVVLDRPEQAIIAIPPEALAPEASASGREGIARAMLVEMEQTWPPEQLDRLLQWLRGPACAMLLASSDLPNKNIRMGGVLLPGFVLPELVRVAAERHPL
ncbi:MAG: hypothetical protein H7Y32_11295 [Chloroflexales bacterium]|nr:hypothetical protein [Chloroflexales bacterium]